MPGQNNGRNSSIPRGYRSEDTEARKEWVKSFSGVELDDTLEDEVEDLLEVVQSFEPAGVGARNLQECLLLQMNKKEETENLLLAKQLITKMM